MTTDNFSFYLQNRLIQKGQTGGQQYNDTFPFSIPWNDNQNKKASPFPVVNTFPILIRLIKLF
jgi:hypothetical protein